MNKRGFTLIELITAILIISLLAGIATVSYSVILNKISERAYETYMDTMHSEAIQYVLKNTITWTNNQKSLYLSDLGIEPINNPKNHNDLCNSNETYVLITKTYVGNNPSMTYDVYLKCNDYNNHKIYEN